MKCLSGILCRAFVTGLLCIAACGPAGSPTDLAYEHLDSIRDGKRRELTEHLESVARTARSIRKDTLLARFFELKNEYYRLCQSVPPPPEAREAVEKLKEGVKQRYMERYLSFYDILCINTDGDIFYTIRKQADYHKNLFDGDLQKTSLAKRLSTMKTESFVDFQYYHVSGEPSAFFVEPVLINNELVGWFALQYATNKLNNIMQNSTRLGSTGEVVLVNTDRYLLTDSRFKAASTILKQQLPRENIEDKFLERRGHKAVVDYRGFRVLSSFEVCSVLGSEWLLIVKMHEAEIVTNYYKKHRWRIWQCPEGEARASVPNRTPVPPLVTNDLVEVDMDEFRRVDPGQIVFTHGITTCTGVCISMPGEFCYLAHLSPVDIHAGGSKTDLVGTMMTRIRTLEVLPYNLTKLEVVIAAPHRETVRSIVDALVGNGLFLSQIRFVHRGGNSYANLYAECGTNMAVVEWVDRSGRAAPIRQNVTDFEDLGRWIGRSREKWNMRGSAVVHDPE